MLRNKNVKNKIILFLKFYLKLGNYYYFFKFQKHSTSLYKFIFFLTEMFDYF